MTSTATVRPQLDVDEKVTTLDVTITDPNTASTERFLVDVTNDRDLATALAEHGYATTGTWSVYPEGDALVIEHRLNRIEVAA